MANSIEIFKESSPSNESYWRSINLFGKNVASYKFALAESLIKLAREGNTEVSLTDLASPYSEALCRHIKEAPRQATSSSSQFLDACTNYNSGIITQDELISTTVSKGFNNVIDAFHNVNGAPVETHFFEKNYDGRKKSIILTDFMFQIAENNEVKNLLIENEARWHLVETAWELNVSRSLLDVSYDDTKGMFFVNPKHDRKDVTSARGALNGYQKGKCFYCYDYIIAMDSGNNKCDVDHFFPIILQKYIDKVNLNGVWNLVLSCIDCNRGENGKFAKVPALKYLERLHKRNEFLISSHHPLRETIMRQTGQTETQRAVFLNDIYRFAKSMLIHEWQIEERAAASF